LLATLQAQIDRTREAEAGVRASEAKYLGLFEASPDAICLWDFDGRILDCNEAAVHLLGFAREEFIGMNVGGLLPPEQLQNFSEFRKKILADGRATVKVRFLTKSGARIPTEVSIRVARIGSEDRMVVHARDLRPGERAEAVKSALYEISQAASGAADLATLYALIRKTITALLPYPNFYVALIDEPAGWITFPLFIDEYDAPPAGRPLGRGLTEYVFRSGQPLLTSSQNTLALRDAGEVDLLGQLAVNWLGVPLKIAEAKIGVMAIQTYRPQEHIGQEEKDLLQFLSTQVALAIDRVRARERLQASLGEKEALLREIHHRVKNNLQIISSLLNLQAGSIHDQAALESIRECQSRIRSMSLVHEKLYQSQNLAQIQFADYIQSLAVHLFHFWRIGADRIRLETNLDPVVMDINTAIPGGLIVNEMISNALEHAFPDGRAGTVRITLRDLGSETYEIAVRDDGVGLPEGFDPAAGGTLGLQLIDLLARQLGGEVRLTREGGTSFAVTFKEQKTRPRA
ncbi:MAG: PAS domain S-box protein, partial [Candidatus Aminicenantes bacterium]|nr:PAS domain S-box protein [Candidatus Aminicenantes bacterium]